MRLFLTIAILLLCSSALMPTLATTIYSAREADGTLILSDKPIEGTTQIKKMEVAEIETTATLKKPTTPSLPSSHSVNNNAASTPATGIEASEATPHATIIDSSFDDNSNNTDVESQTIPVKGVHDPLSHMLDSTNEELKQAQEAFENARLSRKLQLEECAYSYKEKKNQHKKTRFECETVTLLPFEERVHKAEQRVQALQIAIDKANFAKHKTS